MFIIADSGSTMTNWSFIRNNELHTSIETIGLNPYIVPPLKISDTISKELSPYLEFKDVEKIFFYGSGCGTEENIEILDDILSDLFTEADIFVYSDLMGAARSVFQKGEGIACILGTGSNTCYYDGTKVYQETPSLGYILGDEGSGTDIGKRFLKAFLYNDLPVELKNKFEAKYSLTLSRVLSGIYKEESPNKYMASFTEFLHENIENVAVESILKASFREYFHAHLLKYEQLKKCHIGFTGYIAHYFSNILEETAKELGIKIHSITTNPMGGLVKYHTSENKTEA